MEIIIVMWTIIVTIWAFASNAQIKELRKNLQQTSRWCATMEIIMKKSGIWVHDKDKKEYVANLYLINNDKIEIDHPYKD